MTAAVRSTVLGRPKSSALSLLGPTLSPAIWTFTRASSATYFDATGTLQTAGNDVPAFDHDPATLAPLGIGLWGQITNIATYSEQSDNAVWVKAAATVSANALVAPDGFTTGDTLQENASTGTHNISRPFTITANTANTYSLFVKAAGRTSFQLIINDGAWVNTLAVQFDLTTGVISSAAVAGGAATISGSGIKACSGGWYRVWLGGVLSATATTAVPYVFLQVTPGNATYTGDGVSGISVFGQMFTQTAFLPPYIPTTTTAATRAADSCVMTAPAFAKYVNPAGGTAFVDGVLPAIPAGQYPVWLSLSNGTVLNEIKCYSAPGGTTALAAVVGGVPAYSGNVTTPVGSTARTGVKWGGASVSEVSCGGAPVALTTAIPTINALSLGINVDNGGSFNGYIRGLALYPGPMSDAQFQALSNTGAALP